METSASAKLTQTRHSHSKYLFHGAHISQGFYREGQKVDTYFRYLDISARPNQSSLATNTA